MKRLILFCGMFLLGVNQASADELNCPVTGGSTVTVAGDDSVSASCGINTDQSFLAPGPAATVNIDTGASLTVGSSGDLANHGNLNTLAGGSLTNDGVLKNGDSIASYFDDFDGPPAGSITNAGVLTNNGELNNYNGFDVPDQGVHLPRSEIINSGSLVNNGTFTNGQSVQYYGCNTFCIYESRGRLTNTGQISNAAGATFINNGIISNTGAITNAGQMDLTRDSYLNSYGGTLNNLATGTINNSGSLYIDALTNDGVFSNNDHHGVEANTISGSGSYTQTRGYVWAFGSVDQGSISILGGNLVGDGVVTTGHLIIGESGRIEVGSDVVDDAGCWEGGYCGEAAGIGLLNVVADVYMAGTLELRVGSDGYAAMAVDGVLDLDGATLRFFEDYKGDFDDHVDVTLELGDSFDLVTASAINGEFANLYLEGLDAGLNWRTQYITANGSEIFRATVVPVPAAAWLFGSALALLGWKRRRWSH